MSLFTFFFKPIGRLTAYHVLLRRLRNSQTDGGDFWTKPEINHLMDETWRRYAAFESQISLEPTVGSRLSVRLATLDICLYQALQVLGIERNDAIQIVKEFNWAVYKQAMKLPLWYATIITRNPTRKLRTILNLIMTRFPFNPPGFEVEMLVSERGGRLDVLRCPVAEQMLALLPEQDARDLCVTTWCAQDYPTAEIWGSKLERSGTIAGGADRCDFHFIADE